VAARFRTAPVRHGTLLISDRSIGWVMVVLGRSETERGTADRTHGASPLQEAKRPIASSENPRRPTSVMRIVIPPVAAQRVVIGARKLTKNPAMPSLSLVLRRDGRLERGGGITTAFLEPAQLVLLPMPRIFWTRHARSLRKRKEKPPGVQEHVFLRCRAAFPPSKGLRGRSECRIEITGQRATR
jgi:hypothetical protein